MARRRDMTEAEFLDAMKRNGWNPPTIERSDIWHYTGPGRKGTDFGIALGVWIKDKSYSRRAILAYAIKRGREFEVERAKTRKQNALRAAAPDLLATLKALVATVDPEQVAAYPDLYPEVVAAKAAIAKAEPAEEEVATS